jgi:hypothetical protein
MVTNNLLGCSRRLLRYSWIKGEFEKLFFIFFLSRENNATSEPEKNADEIKQRIRNRILNFQSMSKQKIYSKL